MRARRETNASAEATTPLQTARLDAAPAPPALPALCSPVAARLVHPWVLVVPSLASDHTWRGHCLLFGRLAMCSYDFPGSNSGIDMFALTGWIPEQFRTDDNDFDEKRLWERMLSASKYGDCLLTVATGELAVRASI